MKRSLLVLVLVLIAALVLAACGGGSSSSESDQDAIAEAIEKSATSKDPSKCTELQTAAFNEAESEKSGEAALKTCEKEAEEDRSPAESVDVSDVKVNGDTATAVAAVHGSSLDGQALELELVEEEGAWKLNKFLKFTKYKGASLGKALEEELAREEELPPAAIKCVGETFSGYSQEEAEAIVIEHSLQAAEELIRECQ